jgi:hypothetical protein
MALTRLALRLASQEALRPAALLAAGPYPTLAQKYVFDSAFDPIEDLQKEFQQAVVAIYTEDENGDPTAAGGGPPFMATVDLCFELSVVVSTRDGQGDDYVAFYPQTDGELESSLDLLEAQILFTLFYGPTGKIWRDLTKRRVDDLSSLPHHSGEERIRLARRTLRLKVRVQEDIYDPAPAADPAGLDRLPQPLQGVIKALVANGYGAKLGAGLAPDAPVMPVAVPLEIVTLDQSTAAPDDSFAVDGAGAPVIDTPNAADNLDQ